jgi:guanosine-3',5'-bis(diphosphate) 3'-pyrophosphohydrolase
MKKENYESFFRRLTPSVPREDLYDIERAYDVAKNGHRHQCRKETDPTTGKPIRYFEHARGVAIILIDEVGCLDPTLIICTLIHDYVEDNRRGSHERVRHQFGRDVSAIVRLVTKDEATKATYIERLMTEADWRALIVKACDRLHNIRSLACCTPEFQRKQVIETREKYFPLLDLLVKLTPKVHARGARFLRKEIRRLVRQIEATLDKGTPPLAGG